jgi:hypothetical protein
VAGRLTGGGERLGGAAGRATAGGWRTAQERRRGADRAEEKGHGQGKGGYFAPPPAELGL